MSPSFSNLRSYRRSSRAYTRCEKRQVYMYFRYLPHVIIIFRFTFLERLPRSLACTITFFRCIPAYSVGDFQSISDGVFGLRFQVKKCVRYMYFYYEGGFALKVHTARPIPTRPRVQTPHAGVCTSDVVLGYCQLPTLFQMV